MLEGDNTRGGAFCPLSLSPPWGICPFLKKKIANARGEGGGGLELTDALYLIAKGTEIV